MAAAQFLGKLLSQENKTLAKEVLGSAGRNMMATPLSSYIRSSASGAAGGSILGGIHSSIDDRGFWSGATAGAFQGLVAGGATRGFIAGSYKAGAANAFKTTGRGNIMQAAQNYYGAISKQVVALERLGADVSKVTK